MSRLPETSYNSEETAPVKKSKLKDFTINLLIVSFGVIAALGVFVYYKTYQRDLEIKSLIPNAKSAVESKQYSKAISLYSDAEKEFPNDGEIKKSLADLYMMKGRYDDAIRYYEIVDANSDLNDTQTSNLGNAYFITGKQEKVLKLWEGKTLSPKDQYRFSNIFLDAKDYDRYFLELAKIKEYKEPLIYSQINSNSLQEILTNIDKVSSAQSLSDEEIDVTLFKNQITDAKKQLDLGKKDFSELLQISAFSNLNQCYKLTNRITAARTNLEKQRIPTFQIDFLDGKCKNQANQPDLAQTQLQKAIDYDSTNIEYREELANSFYLKNDVINLNKTYADIFVIQKSSDLYFNYAGFLYKLDHKDEALDQYDEAFKRSTDDDDKKLIATYVFQINFFDKKELNICSRSDLISTFAMPISKDDFMILNHCAVKNSSELKLEGLTDDEKQYFNDLKNKDKKNLEILLDRDSERTMTIYYNAIGNKLV